MNNRKFACGVTPSSINLISELEGDTDQSFLHVINTDGNNDEGVSDWEAIPEFGTLLMPVASVLLIVGYNYRRKNNLEA